MSKKIIIAVLAVGLLFGCGMFPESPRLIYIDNWETDSLLCFLLTTEKKNELINNYNVNELSDELVAEYSVYSEVAPELYVYYDGDLKVEEAGRAIIYPPATDEYTVLLHSYGDGSWYELEEGINVTSYLLGGLEGALNPFSHFYLTFDPQGNSELDLFAEDNEFVVIE